MTGLAVIRLTHLDTKFVIASRHIMPVEAIIAPAAMDTLAPAVVASSGFDCMSHAIECYTARAYTRWGKVAEPMARPVIQGANPWSDLGALEALRLVRWYAREHVLLCLVPAFFIAGAIGVFISQGAVMKYLGAGANKVLAYGVASVSGSILAVCSCTVLPLFAGIYKRGAGLGPAAAFLYSGPAINVLAVILTARVLGIELGVARAVGAVVFSIFVGLAMHLLFRREELVKAAAQAEAPQEPAVRPLWQ